MIRKPAILLIALTLALPFACQKKGEVPIPSGGPEKKVEAPKPAEEVKPTPAPVVEPVKEPEDLDRFSLDKNPLDDVYFEFDKSDLTEDTKAILNRYAEVIKANAGLNILIEGHCDERGTEEYNLALGERRAARVREYLASLGVSADTMKTISYGEARPKQEGSSEEAWSQNRRAHFLVSK